jgi:cytoskeleton-associated protein 5
MRPLSNGQRGSHGSISGGDGEITALINGIRNDDTGRSVNTLKAIQGILEVAPERFNNCVHTLIDATLDELDLVFSPPENLEDPVYFRHVKHLTQTITGVTTCPDLVKRLKYDDIYSIIYNLSLRLVQADRLGTLPAGLTEFINMIIIQVLATPDRELVWKAMFQLLLALTRDWTPSWPVHDSTTFGHADLIMKCLWKRSKLLEDDFRSGRLAPGKLLGVLEEFITVVRPEGYRRRAIEGVQLGDMPLRTVKSLIQKILGESLYAFFAGD